MSSSASDNGVAPHNAEFLILYPLDLSAINLRHSFGIRGAYYSFAESQLNRGPAASLQAAQEDPMPFTITPQCSGKDTICESICPYDCIKTAESIASDSRSHLQIDAQFCVDCGLCTIACPEQAIVYAGAFNPMSLSALGQAPWMRPRARRLSVATIAEAAVSLSASRTSMETNR